MEFNKEELRLYLGNTEAVKLVMEAFGLLGFDVVGSCMRNPNYVTINPQKHSIHSYYVSCGTDFLNMTLHKSNISINLTSVDKLRVKSLDYDLKFRKDGTLQIGCQTINKEDLKLIKEFLQKGE